jgi:hypothetical protein
MKHPHSNKMTTREFELIASFFSLERPHHIGLLEKQRRPEEKQRRETEIKALTSVSTVATIRHNSE